MAELFKPTAGNERKAIAQAIAIASAVYQDRRETLDSWLSPEAEVILWYRTERWFRPCAAIIRQAPFLYYLAVEGTMGFTQASWQGGPMNALSSATEDGWSIGAFYREIASELMNVFEQYIPTNINTTEIIISGHSLGGALAMDLARRFMSRTEVNRVSLVTLGQPKTIAEGFQGFLPGRYLRVYSNNDLVTQYPGNSNSWILSQLATPSSWVPAFNRWEHFGEALPLNYVGQFGPNPNPIGPIPTGVRVGDWVEHGMLNYISRVRAFEMGQATPDPVVRSAINLAVSVLDGDPANRIGGPFITQMGLPPNAEAALAQRIGAWWLPLNEVSGGGMAVVKHVWQFFDQRGANWSETYYVQATSANTSLALLTEAFTSTRLNLLYTGNMLRSVRATEVGGARTTAYKILNLAGVAGIKAQADTPDVTSTAAVYDLRGALGGSRKIWIRGLWDEDVERSPLNGMDRPSARLRQSAETWFKACKDAGYSIQYRSKPGQGANTDYRTVQGVDGTAGSGVSLLTINDPTGYVKGDRVTISLFDSKQLPRINGEFTVLMVVGTSIGIAYRTPGNLNYAEAGGRMRRIVMQNLATIDPALATFDHFGSRQTKSDFTRSRGSRRAARTRLSVSTPGAGS